MYTYHMNEHQLPQQDDIHLMVDEEKKTRIRQLIQKLETLQGVTVESTPLTYSKDQEVFLQIPRIVEMVKDSRVQIKAAVIVSNGGVWSLPKEIPGIDLVLRINYNRNQITQDKQRREAILAATTVEQLLPQPSPDLNTDNITERQNEFWRLKAPKDEMECYRQYHYLSSQDQLLKTQDFLRLESIAFIGGDLTDVEFMKNLGDILREYQAEIVFEDLSNVMEWVDEKKDLYVTSLGQLPMMRGLPILYSTHTGRTGRSPMISDLCYGLKDYQYR